jgi:hypothetical protein
MTMRTQAAIAAIMLCGAAAAGPSVQPIALQNATSTYTQGEELWGPQKTIDGIASGTFTSWAIAREGVGNAQALPETIVWETVNDVDLSAGGLVKFTLCQHDFIPIPGHNIGRFRLSYTTDARDSFADGLGIGGDVDANWTVIRPLAAQSDGGEILFFLKDHSILVQGGANGYSIYTVVTHLAASGITGFRMEALEHRTLPFRGPGRQAVNGNMHLSEFKVELTTETGLRPGVC